MSPAILQRAQIALNARRQRVEILRHDDVLASNALWPRSVFARGRGLLGTKELVPGRDGCLLDPCRRIHCRGMRYPIDTIHLDKNGSIVGLERVEIGKIGSKFKGSRSILELAAGEIERFDLKIGDALSVSLASTNWTF